MLSEVESPNRVKLGVKIKKVHAGRVKLVRFSYDLGSARRHRGCQLTPRGLFLPHCVAMIILRLVLLVVGIISPCLQAMFSDKRAKRRSMSFMKLSVIKSPRPPGKTSPENSDDLREEKSVESSGEHAAAIETPQVTFQGADQIGSDDGMANCGQSGSQTSDSSASHNSIQNSPSKQLPRRFRQKSLRKRSSSLEEKTEPRAPFFFHRKKIDNELINPAVNEEKPEAPTVTGLPLNNSSVSLECSSPPTETSRNPTSIQSSSEATTEDPSDRKRKLYRKSRPMSSSTSQIADRRIKHLEKRIEPINVRRVGGSANSSPREDKKSEVNPAAVRTSLSDSVPRRSDASESSETVKHKSDRPLPRKSSPRTPSKSLTGSTESLKTLSADKLLLSASQTKIVLCAEPDPGPALPPTESRRRRRVDSSKSSNAQTGEDDLEKLIACLDAFPSSNSSRRSPRKVERLDSSSHSKRSSPRLSPRGRSSEKLSVNEKSHSRSHSKSKSQSKSNTRSKSRSRDRRDPDIPSLIDSLKSTEGSSGPTNEQLLSCLADHQDALSESCDEMQDAFNTRKLRKMIRILRSDSDERQEDEDQAGGLRPESIELHIQALKDLGF